MTIDQYREQHNTELTIGDLFDRRTIPEWISSDVDVDQLIAICIGGCESGAYMPAVTYHEAKATMAKHGDEVLDYLEQIYGVDDMPQPQSPFSWGAIACHYLSEAVEAYAYEALGRLDIQL